ncbi:acyltransferase [Bifidobacterium sp. H1HS10N]|uniref:acyltransferase n=1 Tax=Bifidobacterium kimbladii TaxID=1293826 RepID=UPI0028BF4FD3|nr:acyltransferase [Bifidobacterium sp. H1HS10N]MDT7512436.1 acyltransferase [Bifidobacterium sp. H1HS10N]
MSQPEKVTSRSARSLNIELLRILAMLLVVYCHMIIHVDFTNGISRIVLPMYPGWKSAISFTIVQYGQVGVSIFFMISGYFLVKKHFSWRRIFSTWFQMFLYAVLCLVIAFVVKQFLTLPFGTNELLSGSQSLDTVLWSLCPFLYNSYWFIDAYILMLFLSPFINAIYAHMSQKQVLALIALLMFIGTWPLFFSRVNYWNNVVYAVLGYAIGAYIQTYRDSLRAISNSALAICTVLCTALMLGFNHFVLSGSRWAQRLTWTGQIHQGLQILPICIAFCFFVATCRLPQLRLPHVWSTFLLQVSAGTFGVYLLHENTFGFRFVWGAVAAYLPNISSKSDFILTCLVTGLLTFIVLDIIAMLIDGLLTHPLRKFIVNKIKGTK